MSEQLKDEIFKAVRAEVDTATEKFAAFNSTHEGYAVILEELDELWECVKQNDQTTAMYNEAIQVAAMAIRFVMDLGKAK